jgi:hypothetical protein
VNRRRLKRRLFWTALILALLLIWLIGQVLSTGAGGRAQDQT